MKLHLTPGTAYKIINGERVSVTEIEAQNPSKCECGMDCCNGGIYIKDIKTGTVSVLWIEDGTIHVGTHAQFNTARSQY